MVDNAANYLLFLIGLSGSVSVLIDKLKPMFLETILERSGEQAYILSIYGIRIVSSFIAVAMFGGIPTLIEIVPFFARVPEIGVWVISVLLISLGSDWMHVILDFLYALRDGKRDSGSMISFPSDMDYMPVSTPPAPKQTDSTEPIG
jgi:hypothetical protein